MGSGCWSQPALPGVAAGAVYLWLSLLSLSLLVPTAEAKVFVALAWRVGILSSGCVNMG